MMLKSLQYKGGGVFPSHQRLSHPKGGWSQLKKGCTFNMLSFQITVIIIILLLIGLPGPCKDIKASDVTKNSCKLTWEPPEYDGGSPILHYVLERREAGRRTYIPVMSGENKLSWTVKDLIPNGEYFFRVKAVNKIGGGEYIELKNPVIAQDPKRKFGHG